MMSPFLLLKQVLSSCLFWTAVKHSLVKDSRLCSYSAILKTENWKAKTNNAMGVSSGPKLSGMQKQVLALYRGFLRAARSKPIEVRRQIETVVSSEFRQKSKQVDRKNFQYIEYLIRRGRKQLDQLKSHDTVGLSSFSVSSSQRKES